MSNLEKNTNRYEAQNLGTPIFSAEEQARRVKDPNALPTQACLPEVHVIALKDENLMNELKRMFGGRVEMFGYDPNFRNLIGRLVSQEQFGLLRGVDLDKVLSLKKDVRVCLEQTRDSSRLAFYKLAQQDQPGFGPGVHV